MLAHPLDEHLRLVGSAPGAGHQVDHDLARCHHGDGLLPRRPFVEYRVERLDECDVGAGVDWSQGGRLYQAPDVVVVAQQNAWRGHRRELGGCPGTAYRIARGTRAKGFDKWRQAPRRKVPTHALGMKGRVLLGPATK